jgi:hypothetical protein
MQLTTHNVRIGAALALPITLAAGTVALAALLFASDVRPLRPTPHTPAQVIVLDDLLVPPQASTVPAAADHRG